MNPPKVTGGNTRTAQAPCTILPFELKEKKPLLAIEVCLELIKFNAIANETLFFLHIDICSEQILMQPAVAEYSLAEISEKKKKRF